MVSIKLKNVFCRPYFLLFSLFFLLFSCLASSEEKKLSIYEKVEEIIGKDFQNPHQLAYMPVIESSVKIHIDDYMLSKDDYTINRKLGQITIKKEFSQRSKIKIEYNIIPISIKRTYQRQLLAPQEKEAPSEDKQGAGSPQTPEKLSYEGDSSLSFSGTKTLSLSMENARGISINQPTRLNISGNITNDISVSAILSDEDLPLQPEGTTEELEDLDKVLIEIKGKNLSATLGDYESSFDDTEFVLSPKMLEGAQAKGDFDVGGFTLIGAVSKGQSASISLRGIEGQSEYRISLDGKFIIMVAGSEEVWLNGEKMRREADYVIRDYGDPIIEFTNRHLITGNDAIVIDFEYVDEEGNYGQKLYGIRGKIRGSKADSQIGSQPLVDFEKAGIGATIGVSYAIESDDRDNPIISMSNEDIKNLKLNILDPDGDGKLLPAPKGNSVIGFGGKLNLNDNTFMLGELALNKRDHNTFSKLDKIDESKAWKLNGSSVGKRYRLNFDLRGFEPDFTPIGATVSSRNRSTYQQNYDQIGFGNFGTANQLSSPDEKNYSIDLWLEPLKYIEFKGSLGKNSTEYAQPEPSKNVSDYWSRGFTIGLPNTPKISTRYQEVTEKRDNADSSKKTRELLELSYRFMKNLSIRAMNGEIQSLAFDGSSDNIRRSEQNFLIDLPSFWKVALSGELSYERDYSGSEDIGSDKEGLQMRWQKRSLARTATLNLSAKPLSWFDLSGYFGHRRLSSLDDMAVNGVSSDIATNLADLKLNAKYFRINYRIDRKLSTEKEEQYVNYIITLADGQEVKRFLQPGEGSYVRIDEHTYREDFDKGEYIRLIRNVSDKPVASLLFQTVFSLRPRSSFYRGKATEAKGSSIKDYLTKSLSVIELGTRINEEQDNTSKEFYILRELQTEKTIYGSTKYWSRTQISPHKLISLSMDWETNSSLNKRLNSQIRRYGTDRWKIKLESPFIDRFVFGGELGEDDIIEKVSSMPLNIGQVGIAISDISELQRLRAVYVGYNPTKIISRAELRGSYKAEWNDDALTDDPPVQTKTISMQGEVNISFMSRGSSMLKYEIARGTSSGDLPFAKYDFHDGISHKVRLGASYRVKWFTDLILRATYRGEFAEDDKPDHRFEMEATADF